MSHLAESKLKSRKNSISFDSAGSKLVGNLFCPDEFDHTKHYPAVVLGGPLSTVKEQAAGVYAEKLAANGYVALASTTVHSEKARGSLVAMKTPIQSRKICRMPSVFFAH
jgi:fermentation-respiration switch protein FrsA (DUF1100 family)